VSRAGVAVAVLELGEHRVDLHATELGYPLVDRAGDGHTRESTTCQ
jgi:hypothetical protein